MANINVWTLVAGSWVRNSTNGTGGVAAALADTGSGTWKTGQRAWLLRGGAWHLDVDWTTPGTISGVSIALIDRPGSSHAAVSWSVDSTVNDVANGYNVIVVWSRNGTPTTTDPAVPQTNGSSSSPSSNVWAVGDSVSATIHYQTVSGINGGTVTTGSVTLDAGI